jgi:hypothetical protein
MKNEKRTRLGELGARNTAIVPSIVSIYPRTISATVGRESRPVVFNIYVAYIQD